MNLLMSQAKSCRCPAGRQLQTEGDTGRWQRAVGVRQVGSYRLKATPAAGDLQMKLLVDTRSRAHAVCGSSEGRIDSVPWEPDDPDACGR